VNGPQLLEKNAFVNTSVDVDALGFVTFKHDIFSTSAQIPAYAGIPANEYVFAARTGGASEDCWIDDVCINDYVPGPVAVTVSPHTASAKECSTVTLTATATGSAPLSYQWLKNGNPIAGAITPILTTAALSPPGATYTCVVNNNFSSASDSSVVTVSGVPQVVSAKLNCVTLNQVRVSFDSVL